MSGTPPPRLPALAPVPDVHTARASAAQCDARIETTIRRARTFTEGERQQRVDDEWSTVESLRHMILVIDLWLSHTIQGDDDPFHPMALPPTFMPPTLFPGTSVDPNARPSFDTACEVLRQRIAALGHFVEELVTTDELARPVDAQLQTVAGALSVIFHELAAHDRFINRDLDHLRADGV